MRILHVLDHSIGHNIGLEDKCAVAHRLLDLIDLRPVEFRSGKTGRQRMELR